MNGIKKNKLLRDVVIPFVLITFSVVLAAFSLEEFLVPSKILDGGITGISMIINFITGKPLGLFIFILNLPFLLIGLKLLGKGFLIKSGYAMILFSVLLEVFRPMTNATTDPVLACVFGGILLGFGVGTIIKHGGCLDGTEIVAVLISKKTAFSVGQIVFGANLVIYFIAGLFFGWDRAMYSLLTYFITFKIIDIVEEGFNQAKAVMIITNESAEIAENIYKRLGRTVTILEGEGLISGKKAVLYSVVTRMELHELKNIVQSGDVSAFVTISEVSEIVGKHIKKKKPEN